jgi:hypothetical protein
MAPWRSSGGATARQPCDKVTGKPAEWFTFDPRIPAPAHQDQTTPGELLRKRSSPASLQRHLRQPLGERVLVALFCRGVQKGGLKFWLRFIENLDRRGSSAITHPSDKGHPRLPMPRAGRPDACW